MRYLTGFSIPYGTTNATVSTPSKVSPAIWYYVSFMAVFTDNTTGGTLQLQFSNDNPSGQSEENFTPTNWQNVPGSTATATVLAGAGGVVYPPQNFVGRWYRTTWTRTGGSGTFGVTYCALSA